MFRSYKTEIDPTKEQKDIIKRTIGTCRFIYNFYLAHNKEAYEKGKPFVSAMDFSKWLNNDFIPNNPEYHWIKEVSTVSVRKSFGNAENAYKRFFKKQARFPRFKKKGKSDVKMYFMRTNKSYIIKRERHRIKIPTLGWVRIKEKGYIPTNTETHTIISGTVSCKAGRYYVSVLVEEQEPEKPVLNDFGIGIDLGIKDFAICSDGKTYKNINKTSSMKKLEKKLEREQRSLSRKYEAHKKTNGEGEGKNIEKQKIKVERLYQRIANIRTDHLNKCISEIVKTKPSYITIEDLNVSGMMKNRHLSKAVASQKFFEFRTKLTEKCKENGIELRVVDRFYPSSKLVMVVVA